MVRILSVHHARRAARGSAGRSAATAQTTLFPPRGSARRAGARTPRCRFRGRSATASGCSARSAISRFHAESARGRSILASEQALGTAERRPRLGPQYGEPALHRPAGPRQRALHPRQRQGKLSDTVDHPVTVRLTGQVPVGATCAWSLDDGDGPQAIHLRLRRAGQFPRRATAAPPSPPSMSRPAPTRRSGSLPRSRCATSSSPASATVSRRAKAIRTGRSRCRTRVFASAPISASADAQYYRPSRAGYKGGRACEAPDRCRCGSARARCG